MSFTREQWSRDLLYAVGNITPSNNILWFLVGWTCSETFTNSGAKFNLLNTTEPWTGDSIFNSVGVRNYATYADGIAANYTTLKNGYYPNLFTMLQSDKYNFTGFIQTELAKWSGGTPYGSAFLSIGANGRGGDTFNYGSSPVPTPIPTPLPLTPTSNQRNAGVAQWIAPWLSLHEPSPPTGTGIFDLWLGYLIAGHNLGPPISWEYDTIDWSGNKIVAQEFARARCEWVDGAGKFYDENGIISL